MIPDDLLGFTCAVCGEPVAEAMSAECNWCDQRYHLNQRSDVDGKDCGAVWIDEQFLALQFACGNCLSEEGTPETARGKSAPRRQISGRPRRYKRRA
jgi:hypothetical protein